MADIMDFMGPMMPRREPARPSLPVPHPASGSAPSILDILAEAATMHGDHSPGVTNNPTAQNVDPQALSDAMLLFGTHHSGHGSFPQLTRALIENLAKGVYGAMDTEGAAQPTLARLLLQGNQDPSMMSLMALDNPSEPKLSSYFERHSPTDNPAGMLEASNEFARRLQDVAPMNQGANADSFAQSLAESPEGLQPTDMPMVDKVSGDRLDQLYNLNNMLRTLSMAQMQGGARGAQHINNAVGWMSQDYQHRVFQALADAIEQSGIGGGRQVNTMDPASMRSLAPDINPGAMGYGIAADSRAAGNDQPDLQLLLSMMGLGRTMPKGGV